MIAFIVPSTTALAGPSTPAVAIDCKRVTALTAEQGVGIAPAGCIEAVSCRCATGVIGTVVPPIAEDILTCSACCGGAVV